MSDEISYKEWVKRYREEHPDARSVPVPARFVRRSTLAFPDEVLDGAVLLILDGLT